MWCVHFIKSPEPLMHMTINLLCHKVSVPVLRFLFVASLCVCVRGGNHVSGTLGTFIVKSKSEALILHGACREENS